MPWVKLDDAMPKHPKVQHLGNRAFRSHIEAICYSAHYLTDGLIETDVARREGWTKDALALTDAGVWEETGTGWRIHDYLAYNPSRQQVLRERAQVKRRVSRYRNGVTNAAPDPDPHPDPVPDPQREIDSPLTPHPDALAVYRALADSMGIQSPPIGWAETWLQTRSLEQITVAIGVARERGVSNTRYLDEILKKPPKIVRSSYAPAANLSGPFAHLIHLGAD